MEASIVIALIGLVGGVATATITLVINRLNRRDAVKDSAQKEIDGVTDGVRELLYFQIKKRCELCIRDGYITVDGYEDIKRWHRIYHDGLHGNGFIDGLLAEIEELPKR